MVAWIIHVIRLLIVLASPPRRLVLENLALRQQLAVYRRTAPEPAMRWFDRLFWLGLRRACVREGVEAITRTGVSVSLGIRRFKPGKVDVYWIGSQHLRTDRLIPSRDRPGRGECDEHAVFTG